MIGHKTCLTYVIKIILTVQSTSNKKPQYDFWAHTCMRKPPPSGLSLLHLYLSLGHLQRADSNEQRASERIYMDKGVGLTVRPKQTALYIHVYVSPDSAPRAPPVCLGSRWKRPQDIPPPLTHFCRAARTATASSRLKVSCFVHSFHRHAFDRSYAWRARSNLAHPLPCQ
jgi:hypothetical protein